jgi:hypothetical protein
MTRVQVTSVNVTLADAFDVAVGVGSVVGLASPQDTTANMRIPNIIDIRFFNITSS